MCVPVDSPDMMPENFWKRCISTVTWPLKFTYALSRAPSNFLLSWFICFSVMWLILTNQLSFLRCLPTEAYCSATITTSAISGLLLWLFQWCSVRYRHPRWTAIFCPKIREILDAFLSLSPILQSAPLARSPYATGLLINYLCILILLICFVLQVCGCWRSPCSSLSDMAVGFWWGGKNQAVPSQRQTVPYNKKR